MRHQTWFHPTFLCANLPLVLNHAMLGPIPLLSVERAIACLLKVDGGDDYRQQDQRGRGGG